MNKERNHPMRYIQPQVINTFEAVSSIQGTKVPFSMETGTELPTTGAAYEADE